MKDDFEVITHKLSPDLKEIHIYGLADWHVGSKECDYDLIEAQVRTILKDKNAYCVYAGDALNNALASSKSNVYEETMTPLEEKEKVYQLLKPLAEAGRILAICDGNHEQRSIRSGAASPLYDVCCRLQIEDLFRQNMCIVKVAFGRCSFGRDTSQNVYYGLVIHGSSRNKHRKFEYSFDNLDWCISGHTHSPEMASRGKIRIDTQRATAKVVPFKSIIVCPALGAGGYGIQKEYEPNGPRELQYLTLGTIGRDKVKQMEYHTKQL